MAKTKAVYVTTGSDEVRRLASFIAACDDWEIPEHERSDLWEAYSAQDIDVDEFFEEFEAFCERHGQ